MPALFFGISKLEKELEKMVLNLEKYTLTYFFRVGRPPSTLHVK